MKPSICFVGLENLPVLAAEYGMHGVGGAQLQQTLLAKALTRLGFRVSMVVADYGQDDGATWHGIRTFKAYNKKDGLPGLRFLHPRITGIWAAMRRADADIYYVSCAGMLIAEAALFAQWHGRKTIFRIASDSDCDPNKLLVRLARDKMLYRWGLRRADTVLAQTNHQQEALLSNFGRRSEVAKSVADVSGEDLPFEQRPIDVLWVSNIQQLKRPELLLDVAARLPHLQFHVVGGSVRGHEQLYDRTRARSLELGNVTFRGPLPYHETRTLYSRAKLLVNTSEIEGFPNTYLQAWANGSPVVAFHDPNHLIEEQKLGHAAKTPDDMANAVVALAANKTEWQACSERCRSFLACNYSDESTLREYLVAIEHLTRRG